ncbi:MAG TPA: hypothetical protein VE690_23780, partial [Rhodopila sp.]|nr:hypothetical protein [Rhodopila sp.]
MSLGVVPFAVPLPPGYSLPGDAAGTSAAAGLSQASAGATASAPTDVVSLSNSWNSGTVTAVAGDTFRVNDLFKASAVSGQSVLGYHVALGGNGGQLLLNGVDVSTRSSFTADEFAHLTFVAGAQGSQQNLTVVAQAGKTLSHGTISGQTDSQAVQITAAVTGTRSINAMNALATLATGTDAATIAAVKEAGILSGLGTSRPSLSTDGNFTAQASDVYRITDLFKASAASSGQSILGYRVALSGTGGQLLLNGVDVSSRSSFTADEFAHLTFVAGAQG